MSWLDKIEGHAKGKAKEAAQPIGKPVPILIQIRSPDEHTGDPGEVAIGHYALDGNTVSLVDENGLRLDGSDTATVTNADHAPATAARLLRDRRAGDAGDFGRRLRYGRGPVY